MGQYTQIHLGQAGLPAPGKRAGLPANTHWVARRYADTPEGSSSVAQLDSRTAS